MPGFLIGLAILIGLMSSGRFQDNYSDSRGKRSYLIYARSRVRILSDDIHKCIEDRLRPSSGATTYSVEGSIVLANESMHFENITILEPEGKFNDCAELPKTKQYFPSISMIKVEDVHLDKVFHFNFSYKTEHQKSGIIKALEYKMEESLW